MSEYLKSFLIIYGFIAAVLFLSFDDAAHSPLVVSGFIFSVPFMVEGLRCLDKYNKGKEKRNLALSTILGMGYYERRANVFCSLGFLAVLLPAIYYLLKNPTETKEFVACIFGVGAVIFLGFVLVGTCDSVICATREKQEKRQKEMDEQRMAELRELEREKALKDKEREEEERRLFEERRRKMQRAFNAFIIRLSE